MRSKMPKRQLLLHRTGGVQGPFYQNTGRGLIKTVGSAYAPSGPLSLPKPTSGEVCVATDNIVNLSTEVTWTSQGIWTFTNQTTAESTTGTITSSSPTSSLIFNITWITDPVENDSIVVSYNGLGDFYKTGGDSTDDKMESFDDFVLHNCLNLPPPSGNSVEWVTGTDIEWSGTDTMEWT